MSRCRFGLAFLCLLACSPPARTTGGARAPVQILVQPEAGAASVLGLVSAARGAVWMEMYLLTDAGAIAALVDRRRAGCDVRVLLEQHPFQADGANDAAFAELAAAGVVVRWANPRFALTHAKTAVIDHARLVVLTLNLTRAGLAGNREYVAVDDDPADVAAAEAVIASDLTGDADPALPAGSRLVASPGGTRPAVAALIEGAHRALAVEMEELSDAALVAALAAAVARGVDVRIGLPDAATQSAATRSAAARLTAAGGVVRPIATPPLHAKVILADTARLYLGSANLTTASLEVNRELGLVLQVGDANVGAGDLVAETLSSDLAP